jgi:enoyl-CoA hydratase
MSEISETGAATADFDVRWPDGGAVFTITRPRKMNAITKAVLEGLSACLDELEAGRGRFLVIAGEGDRAFSAGTDLAEAAGMDEAPLKAKTEYAQALLFRLSRSPVLSVAAMNGSAYGGGLEFAMACTFRVAAPHIVMSMPEIKLGLLPSYGGTQFLPAIVGKAHALDLMLTGRTISAREALVIGLVNRIAETPASVAEEALALAQSTAAFSQPALTAIRRCVEAAGDTVTEDGLAVERAEVNANKTTHDSKEGPRAFLEKRPPRWEHR